MQYCFKMFISLIACLFTFVLPAASFAQGSLESRISVLEEKVTTRQINETSRNIIADEMAAAQSALKQAQEKFTNAEKKSSDALQTASIGAVVSILVAIIAGWTANFTAKNRLDREMGQKTRELDIASTQLQRETWNALWVSFSEQSHYREQMEALLNATVRRKTDAREAINELHDLVTKRADHNEIFWYLVFLNPEVGVPLVEEIKRVYKASMPENNLSGQRGFAENDIKPVFDNVNKLFQPPVPAK